MLKDFNLLRMNYISLVNTYLNLLSKVNYLNNFYLSIKKINE